MNAVHIEHRSEFRLESSVRTKWGDRPARRGDIVRAGRSLLRESGLVGLQMRDVARRADVALGTVYTYFPTKEALFAALYAERIDQMLNDLTPQLASTTDLEELFVVVATSYRDVYAEFGKDLDILSVIGERSQVDRATRDQLFASSSQLLNEARKTLRRVGVTDTELALGLLWSTITGLADHFTSARHELLRNTWDETVRFTARTIERGLVTALTHGGEHG
jgi:AcrR family transcriptional regulator